jgi:MHS family proline/betaine transporter-like MFS transporter
MAALTPQEPHRDWRVEDVTVTEPAVIRRAIGAAAIGNVTEWYDFGVYAYFEPTIEEVVFADLPARWARSRPSGCSPPRSWSDRSAVLRAARGPDRPQQGAGDHQLLAWGWRIPFFLALPLGLVGVYLRTRLADTPAFLALEKESEEREKQQRTGQEFKQILTLWRFMLVLHGAGAGLERHQLHADLLHAHLRHRDDAGHAGRRVGLGDHVPAPAVRGHGRRAADHPAGGHPLGPDRSQADRVGRSGRADRARAALDPADQGPDGSVDLPRPAGHGPAADLLQRDDASTSPSLFPTEVRGGGLSIAFNVLVSLFAGTTSLVVGALVIATGDLNWPAYYLVIAGVIGVVSIWFTQESNGRRLWGSSPSAADDDEARELVDAQAG